MQFANKNDNTMILFKYMRLLHQYIILNNVIKYRFNNINKSVTQVELVI